RGEVRTPLRYVWRSRRLDHAEERPALNAAERVETVHQGVIARGERGGRCDVRGLPSVPGVEDGAQHVVVADPYGHERRENLARALQLRAAAEQEQLVGIRGGPRWLGRPVIRIEQLQDFRTREGHVVEQGRCVFPERAERVRKSADAR